MAPVNKVLNHLDKDEIIKKLTMGESVRAVESWLADRYPEESQAHLRISFSTLQNFKTQNLNIKGRVLEDIKDAARATQQAIKREVIQQEVESTNAYQEAIQAIAAERLDVQSELVEVFHILKSRVEHFYNKLQNQDFSDKQEKAFQKYIDQVMSALESYKKYVEGYNETVDHNINISIMTDQVGIIREAVREVLVEMDPEFAVRFMGNLNEKMRSLQYKNPHSLTGDYVDISEYVDVS